MAADIVLSDLTTGTLDGTGVFDKLMAAANLHIDDQYQKNRLKGAEYATVYLGVIESIIAQSVQFLLQEKMVEAQIDGVVADNALKAQQLLTEEQTTAKVKYEVDNLLPKQLTKLQEEVEVAHLQVVKLDKEAVMMGLDDMMKVSKEAKTGTKVYDIKYISV